MRQWFTTYRQNIVSEYDNGSTLPGGGMADDNQREQIRSIGQDGSVDIVWMEEATGFTENDFNEVTARIRGRAAPWGSDRSRPTPTRRRTGFTNG